MAQPEEREDPEAQSVGDEVAPVLGEESLERRASRPRQLQHEDRDRDGEDRVAEEDEPLEIQSHLGGFQPVAVATPAVGATRHSDSLGRNGALSMRQS
jgi:hypothetical protein